MSEEARLWVPDVAPAFVVAVLGIVEMSLMGAMPSDLLLVALTALAVLLSRRRPGIALGIAWLTLAGHLVVGVPFSLVELGFLVVAFGVARWGDTTTLALSIVSILAGSALLVYVIALHPSVLYDALPPLRDLVFTGQVGIPGRFGTGVVAAAVLGTPWLLGLALRFADRARTSETEQSRAEERADLAVAESAQAREIARLQEESARLARDVHDVVGHSLAVILAQAEAGQYLPDDDPERLKRTMATIAGSARDSLRDVRAVLSAESAASSTSASLDSLVDGVRSGGRDVEVHELGTPRPLPPEVDATAFRTLQEMLTNAVRHGARDTPVRVERLWPDDTFSGELRLEVSNGVDPDAPTADAGRGLTGMRQRLEAVDGRLDVRRRAGVDATTFTVTAWLPVSRRAPGR